MTEFLTAQQHQDHLQLTALGFMHRHQARFGNDHLLCAASVQHLMDALDASQESAENAVIRAYGELRYQGDCGYLDLTLSTGHLAVLRNPANHGLYLLPVATLMHHLVDRRINQRLYLAATH